ncbi:MAG: YceI family protein [Actinomycetota bacterium]
MRTSLSWNSRFGTSRATGRQPSRTSTGGRACGWQTSGRVSRWPGRDKIGGTLTGTIKRSEWDLTWNVPLDTGGWLVSDNVTIEIDLQVAQSQEAVVQEEAAESKVSA